MLAGRYICLSRSLDHFFQLFIILLDFYKTGVRYVSIGHARSEKLYSSVLPLPSWVLSPVFALMSMTQWYRPDHPTIVDKSVLFDETSRTMRKAKIVCGV